MKWGGTNPVMWDGCSLPDTYCTYKSQHNFQVYKSQATPGDPLRLLYTCTCSYMHLIYDLTECIWPLTIHNPRGKLYQLGVANSLVILATDIIGMPSLVLRLAVRGTTTLQSTHWPHPSSTTANHLVNQHVHCPSDVLTRCGRVASSRETNTSTLHSLCFWLPAPSQMLLPINSRKLGGSLSQSLSPVSIRTTT